MNDDHNAQEDYISDLNSMLIDHVSCCGHDHLINYCTKIVARCDANNIGIEH
jgi:hypothetical protein